MPRGARVGGEASLLPSRATAAHVYQPALVLTVRQSWGSTLSSLGRGRGGCTHSPIL